VAGDAFLQDLRYTLRTLRRDPAFTTFAILIVGLGIGASTTVFSVVNTLLVRPLPFHEPGRLVWIANHDVSGLSGQTTQVNHFLDLREQSKSYTDLAAYFAFYGVGDTILTGSGDPERLSGVPVSQNFFDLLGVKPLRGRLFHDEECKWHGPKAVLISHGLWIRRFASDPTLVGRALTLNDEPVTVVGVLPPGFDFATVFAPGRHIDLYFPFPLTNETNRWGNTIAILGRLRPNATPSSAQAELTIIADRLTKAHPTDRNSFEGRIKPLADYVSGRLRLALLVLACAVGVVMLIVCTNLSNLLLARTATRQKEIAIRTAVGAGRGRLIRQMLTEGIVLSTCGAALGLLLAGVGAKALTHLDAMRIPLLQNVSVDRTALAFALGTTILVGLVFGLAPALQISAVGLHDVLKDSSRGATAGKGRSWMRSALVVTEIAFACVLLVGAGLLIRSFVRLLDVNLGFQPSRAATVRVDPDTRYRTRAQRNAYFDDVLRRARGITGVEAAGITDSLPLGKNRSWGAGEKGHIYPKGKYPVAYVRVVTDGYLRAMGIPLSAGRDISERDTPDTQPVILINETMARTLFPGQSALGKTLMACGARQIVGVAKDVRHLALEEASGFEMYLPVRQCPDYASADLVLRTSLPPAQLAAAVRAALKPIAPNITGNDFRPVQQLVDTAVSPRRFVVLLLAGFALFALILASLGIYGVISYSVNQRKQEIGIRMALGATAANLEVSILLHTLGLAVIGIVLGGAASLALARVISGLLYDVTATDPITFAGMLVVLTAVAATAGYIPARRAARVDPTTALRAS
jgi:predicted permease